MTELELDRVVGMARGYQEARILLTASELELFSILGSSSMTAEDIASLHSWDVNALRVLLDALIVMGFLEKRLGRYFVPRVNRELLSPEDSRMVPAIMRHAASGWHAWSNLTARIVGFGTKPRFDTTACLVKTMHAISQQLAPGIAALVRPEMGRRFLDVGGGSGVYTIAFLERDRSLQATILDRPEVLRITEGYLLRAGYEGRVQLVAGDFVTDEWPAQQDLILLSAVIHTQSLAHCYAMFERAYRALAPGGRIVIRDHIMSEERVFPRTGALFAVHVLVCTEEGRTYSFSEIRRGLAAAGFQDTRLIHDGERMNGIVEAFRP
jgi:predicted O-methyltransferase YrrM